MHALRFLAQSDEILILGGGAALNLFGCNSSCFCALLFLQLRRFNEIHEGTGCTNNGHCLEKNWLLL